MLYPRSAASAVQAELITPVPPMNNISMVSSFLNYVGSANVPGSAANPDVFSINHRVGFLQMIYLQDGREGKFF